MCTYIYIKHMCTYVFMHSVYICTYKTNKLCWKQRQQFGTIFFPFYNTAGLPTREGGKAQEVKNPPAMQETQVRSLAQEDPLEKGMPTHSSILAWEIPRTEDPGGLQSMGLQGVGYKWATNTAHNKTRQKYRYKDNIYIYIYICIKLVLLCLR